MTEYLYGQDIPDYVLAAHHPIRAPHCKYLHLVFINAMPNPAADSIQVSDKATSKANAVASKSALGAAFLVLNQIGSRALTFVVNQLLFRFLSPGIYGVAAQLELFSVSILYFSRESLRNALQRQRGEDTPQNEDGHKTGETEVDPKPPKNRAGPGQRLQEAVNLSHIAIALGVPLTTIFSWLYLRKADAAVLRTRHIHHSLHVYALATVLELLNEPAYAIAQQQMLYGTRASAEFLGSFARCMVTCALAIWASRTETDVGVFPFAMGQLSYALVLNIVYLSKVLPICAQNTVSLLPKDIAHNDGYILSRLSRPLVTIAATFYGQSIFKQFQTSGDGYLIATLASLPSQGAYALATNYGGLLARVLFQPIEESSRSLFGRLFPSQPKASPDTKATDLTAISQAKSHLTRFLHLYALLTLTAISLGPPLSPLFLQTVAGSRWSSTEAPAVLASYCYLIGLLAINGILEAFVTAVATPAQVGVQNMWMAGFSVVFAGTGILVLRVLGMGARGLVVANAVVMGLRIWWSWGFVKGYLEGWGDLKGLRMGEMMPSVGTVAVGFGTRWCLELVLRGKIHVGLQDLIYCGTVVGLFGLGILLCERKFLLSILPGSVLERLSVMKGRREKQMKGDSKKDR